jgi:hypothetical protein
MPISANDTKRKSWLEVAPKVIFHSKPFGFSSKENVVTVGTRIGILL